MRTTRKALAATILFVLLGGGLAAVTALGQEEGDGGKKTVFTVGDPQGIDSMNPIIGVTVAAFEAWNLQYPFLTNKAAKDFSLIPGLATSWKGSEDGLTWTYKLRPGMKWSDGKPLTAEDVAWTINTSREEEWLNHSTTTAEPEGGGQGRHHPGRHVRGARPQAPGPGRVHHAQARVRPHDRRRAGEGPGRARRGRRPVRAGEIREGPVRALQGQPELLRGQAGRRRGGPAQVQQRGRDGGRAEDGRDRRGDRSSHRRVHRAEAGREHPDGRRASRDRWARSPSTAATA